MAIRWKFQGLIYGFAFIAQLLANSANTPNVSLMSSAAKTETATFGAGCFWGVEYNFQNVPGVISAASGYAGGKTKNPTYREVCAGDTDHAEVVEVVFNPEKVSYRKLVEYFFRLHDPTQINRQGPDYGTQYRSIIFWHTDDQKKIAESVMQELTAAKKYKAPLATQLVPASAFWKAEEYHQKYFEKNGGPTCHITEF